MRYKVILFIFFHLIFSLLHAENENNEIDIINFSKKILVCFQNNDFDTFFSYHSLNFNNAQKIIIDAFANINNNDNIDKISNFEKNFLKHKERYEKITKNIFSKNYDIFKDHWNKVIYFTSGLTELNIKYGLLKGDLKIYFILNNKVNLILIKDIIITKNKFLFLTNEIYIQKNLFDVNYFNRNKNIESIINDIFPDIFDIW